MNSKKKICAVIGDPVGHSLSPLMHNAAFAAQGLDQEYLYVARQVQKNELSDVISQMRAGQFRGLSCTIPHKSAVMDLLDEIDNLAWKVGAVNTVVKEGDLLIGYNTDLQGITGPLEKTDHIEGKKVAILGAGGAARAAVFGCLCLGAEVCIFNRTAARAEALATEAGCSWKGLDDLAEVKNYQIIINTTSVGMDPQSSVSPLPEAYLRSSQIVFDIVYNPYETLLLRDAKAAGCRLIYGMEMLVSQGAAQFELFTGKRAPFEIMHQVVKEELLSRRAR